MIETLVFSLISYVFIGLCVSLTLVAQGYLTSAQLIVAAIFDWTALLYYIGRENRKGP